MTISIGDKVGPYEILASIGTGGMGEVFRARDTRLHRDVAIKVSAERFTEHFEREARVVASLNHVNICHLYDVGPNYLVMELVEGQTLAERIKDGAIPVDEALHIARQIAEALEAAHEKGVVHRDLKPANVKISPHGVVKVLDFGLAKLSAGPTANSDDLPTLNATVTQVGMIVGTAAYMSPEQARGKPVDRRADIWAFGVVLYEMVIGNKLFQGESITELLASVLKQEPNWDDIPLRLRHLLRRCLEKDPQQRLRHIGDALEFVASEVPAEATKSPANAKRLWPLIAVGCLVLAAAGWGLAARAWRSAPPASEPIVFSIPPPPGSTFIVPSGGPNGLPWFAVSPDGRVLALIAFSAEGRQQLWTRSFATGIAHPLEGTDGAVAPFWSPDSRRIAFFSRNKLKIVDVDGGTPQIAADAPGIIGTGTWSRNGTIVFATPRGGGLRKIQVGDTGAGQLITHIDPDREEFRVHFAPQFLPDGRHFLFGVGRSAIGMAETWIGSVDGTEPRFLMRSDAVAHYVEPGYLLYKRGALFAQRVEGEDLHSVGDPVRVTDAAIGSNALLTSLAVSASMSGTLVYGAGAPPPEEAQVLWRDRNGRMIGSVDAMNVTGAPAMSRDRAFLMMPRLTQTGGDLWLYDVKRTTLIRFTVDSALERSPVWSPDGKYVAFAASREGTVDQIYRKSIAGPATDELLVPGGGSFPTDWSSDGRLILFHSVAKTDSQRNGWDLWFVSVADRQPKPLLQSVFNEMQGVLSPDGRWIAYVSDESGAFEVYVQAFDGSGAKRLVSRGGGADPRWGALGRELFYISTDRHMMAVPTTTGPSFDAGKPTPLFELDVHDLMFPFMRRYDVTGDGQLFLLQESITRNVQPLTVVVNWPTLLGK
jgi:Tol biopolymer transport system component/tRNA A-37 threonylcarbamoyl transferase component Bud32